MFKKKTIFAYMHGIAVNCKDGEVRLVPTQKEEYMYGQTLGNCL